MRGLRRIAVAALFLVSLPLLTGCGTGGIAKGGDPARGGQLFVQKCASCHTLRAAGAKGTIGPNLDNAFSADKLQKFSLSTIQQVVRDQIELAILPMPQNLFRGKDADSVAAYVAMCASVSSPPSSCRISAALGPALAGLAGKGQKLYASLGCQACHSLTGARGVGPSWKGLYGAKVRLTNGQTVTADEAYLLAKIEDATRTTVAGFPPGVMAGAIKPHSVSLADAKGIVAFIKTLK